MPKKTPNKKPKKNKPFSDEKGRFLPGVSGNPAGRNKNNAYLSDCLRIMMSSNEIKLEVSSLLPGNKSNPNDVKRFYIKSSESFNYAVSVSLISQALKGDVRAIELIFDRMDGKVSQKIESVGEFASMTIEEKRAKLARIMSENNDRSR